MCTFLPRTVPATQGLSSGWSGVSIACLLMCSISRLRSKGPVGSFSQSQLHLCDGGSRLSCHITIININKTTLSLKIKNKFLQFCSLGRPFYSDKTPMCSSNWDMPLKEGLMYRQFETIIQCTELRVRRGALPPSNCATKML